MAINDGGPMFIRSVNCQGEYKDKFFISTLIKDIIIEVGVSNVVQVITDNAPVCKTAGMLVEQAYPSSQMRSHMWNVIGLVRLLLMTNVVMIRNFISNHSMRLSMFTEFSKLKLLVVVDTRFPSMIIIIKRFRTVKGQLQSMVISERWSMYREDNAEKARIVKEKLLDDGWWDSFDYILRFTEPIYSMLRSCDTDKPCLHLVYEIRTAVTLEFANFFGCFEEFGAPHLRSIAVRLLGQVSSSSCCERNWSTYSFIHSTKRNQITLEHAENLVYVHNNLHLLSRKAPQYMKGESKMWDVVGDAFDSMDDVGILGVANLSLNESELEFVLFCGDE
ncbi:hypothetical protein ACS0TY_034738 [Phlomoides rotata]